MGGLTNQEILDRIHDGERYTLLIRKHIPWSDDYFDYQIHFEDDDTYFRIMKDFYNYINEL